MGLFGRRRGASIDYGWIRGEGWKVLRRAIDGAVNDDGFVFIIVSGERGKGKSTLALNMALSIYGREDYVLSSLVFTPEDYENVLEKDVLKARDGRVKMIVWDDVGVHFSTYKWFTPLQRQKMIDFIENFQSVREDVAVIVATIVELEMLPPKLRTAANYIIDMKRRGGGKVFTYSRYLWLRKWRSIGEIEWGPAPPSLYEEYRSLKRKAHRARRRAASLSYNKLAKAYAEVLLALSQQGMLDEETLYGLGIIDKDGRLTRFGGLVLKRAGIEPEELLKSS